MNNKDFDYIIKYIQEYNDYRDSESLLNQIKDEIKTLNLDSLLCLMEIIIQEKKYYALEPILESLDDVFIKKNKQGLVKFFEEHHTQTTDNFLKKITTRSNKLKK
jgi:hypothetical protein